MKKTAREMVAVLDDEEEGVEEDNGERSAIHMSLEQALATTFTHKSVNPNVATLSAPLEASFSTRQLEKEPRAETLGDSTSVEIFIL